MHTIIRITGFVTCLGLTLLWHNAALASCKKLQRKICKKLGKKAFICGVYRTIAEDAKADQKRCQALLSDRWKQRLKSFQRSEKMIQKMDQLARSSQAAGKMQVARYKMNWSLCRIASMRKNAPAHPKACKRLRNIWKRTGTKAQNRRSTAYCKQIILLVCRDLGVGSFYCKLFSKLAQRPGVKESKCKLLRDNWSSSQRYSFQKREKTLQWMIQAARKKPALRMQVENVKKREIVGLYNFLYKK